MKKKAARVDAGPSRNPRNPRGMAEFRPSCFGRPGAARGGGSESPEGGGARTAGALRRGFSLLGHGFRAGVARRSGGVLRSPGVARGSDGGLFSGRRIVADQSTAPPLPWGEVELACRQCGRPFLAPVQVGRRRRFCSAACRRARAVEHRKAWRAEHPRRRPPRPAGACLDCQAAVPPARNGHVARRCPSCTAAFEKVRSHHAAKREPWLADNREGRGAVENPPRGPGA